MKRHVFSPPRWMVLCVWLILPLILFFTISNSLILCFLWLFQYDVDLIYFYIFLYILIYSLPMWWLWEHRRVFSLRVFVLRYVFFFIKDNHYDYHYDFIHSSFMDRELLKRKNNLRFFLVIYSVVLRLLKSVLSQRLKLARWRWLPIRIRNKPSGINTCASLNMWRHWMLYLL